MGLLMSLQPLPRKAWYGAAPIRSFAGDDRVSSFTEPMTEGSGSRVQRRHGGVAQRYLSLIRSLRPPVDTGVSALSKLHELSRTCIGDIVIGFLTTRQRSPALLFDIVAAIVGVLLLQGGKLRRLDLF